MNQKDKLIEAYIHLLESNVAFSNSTIKDIVYHGTDNNFVQFNINHRTKNGKMYGDGIYFTKDIEQAKKYTKTNNIIKGYINLKNPFFIDKEESLEYAIRKENPYEVADIYDKNGAIKSNKVTKYLQKRGFDGVNVENKMFVIFDPNQFQQIFE